MAKRILLPLVLLAGLAACGNTVGEQALFGGATGVGVAAVTGGDPVVGGLVGAGGNVAFCQLYPHLCRR